MASPAGASVSGSSGVIAVAGLIPREFDSNETLSAVGFYPALRSKCNAMNSILNKLFCNRDYLITFRTQKRVSLNTKNPSKNKITNGAKTQHYFSAA